MKTLIFASILFISVYCFADRVCLEKSTGKLIEYQSGEAPLGALTKNAVNVGYNSNDVEEKSVTVDEWKVIKKQWIDDPAEKEKQEKEKIKKQKEDKVKAKLNLSEQDWKDLQDVLK